MSSQTTVRPKFSSYAGMWRLIRLAFKICLSDKRWVQSTNTSTVFFSLEDDDCPFKLSPTVVRSHLRSYGPRHLEVRSIIYSKIRFVKKIFNLLFEISCVTLTFTLFENLVLLKIYISVRITWFYITFVICIQTQKSKLNGH